MFYPVAQGEILKWNCLCPAGREGRSQGVRECRNPAAILKDGGTGAVFPSGRSPGLDRLLFNYGL